VNTDKQVFQYKGFALQMQYYCKVYFSPQIRGRMH